MWPDRVGGIAASCSEAFKPYSPGAGQPGRHLLLVGLGADVRADGPAVGLGPAPVVPAGDPGEGAGGRDRGRLHRGQPARAAPGDPAGRGAGRRLGGAGLPVRRPPRRRRPRQLAAGVVVSSGRAVRRAVRPLHQRHGRPVPGRLRRPGVRGGRLPCGRDDRPQPQHSPGHVRQRRDGDAVLPRPARDLAGHVRAHAADQGPDPGARPDLRPAVRGHGQGGGRLVHGPQHVPRHPDSGHRRGPDAVAAVRRRPAAPDPGPPLPPRCALGGLGPDRRAWPSRSCSVATRSGSSRRPTSPT